MESGGAGGSGDNKQWTRAEVEAHNTLQSAHIIIDNLVYDVTEFLEEHPGGAEVLLDNAGKDASRCFHEVGHSEIAIEWRTKFLVGSLVEADQRPVESRPEARDSPEDDRGVGSLLAACTPPALLALFAVLVYLYLFQ